MKEELAEVLEGGPKVIKNRSLEMGKMGLIPSAIA